MNLYREQLHVILKEWLKEYALPKAIHPHPVFLSLKGPEALLKRLDIILRARNICYTKRNGYIDCEELINLTRPKLKNNCCYIVGLDYWFTEKDIDDLVSIYNKFFS